MKRILLSLLAFMAMTQVCHAEDSYFRFHDSRVDDQGSVTIYAEPDSFFPDENNCMTNPPSDPKKGLVLVVDDSGSKSGTATLEIMSNTLDAAMIQWCMGGTCELMNSTTKLTKSFTAGEDGIVQVDFDANNVRGEGFLEARLTATVDGKTIAVNIIFQPYNASGFHSVIKDTKDQGKCYDLKGNPYRMGNRGIYILHGKKYVNR